MPSPLVFRVRQPATAGPSGTSNATAISSQSTSFVSNCAARWGSPAPSVSGKIGRVAAGDAMGEHSILSTMKLALFVPMLLLAACHSAPPTIVAQPSSTGAWQGIDLPTDASDALNEIKDSQVDFVARYYRSPTSRWPTLSAAEVQRLSSLGLKIVAVWESHSHDPAYFSYAVGYDDAATAYRQAKKVGQPPG